MEIKRNIGVSQSIHATADYTVKFLVCMCRDRWGT